MLLYDHKNDFSIKVFLRNLRQWLLDVNLQVWSEQARNMNKLNFYCSMKQKVNLEKYLTSGIPHLQKKVIARFRCSNHELCIETGRKSNIASEERICKMCRLGEVEDEIHFVFVCPAYSDLRDKLFLNISKSVNFSKIFEILCNEHAVRLSVFLSQAYKRRNAMCIWNVIFECI